MKHRGPCFRTGSQVGFLQGFRVSAGDGILFEGRTPNSETSTTNSEETLRTSDLCASKEEDLMNTVMLLRTNFIGNDRKMKSVENKLAFYFFVTMKVLSN